MNMKIWLDDLKGQKNKKPLPVLSFPGIQLIDTTVDKLVWSADLQADCMKAVADKFETLASVSLMDLSVEAQAFGSDIRFSEGEVPTIVGRIVETPEDAQALKVPEIGAGRTSICIDAIKKAKMLIADRPIFAGVIGPFSLAGRLMDMTEIMINCHEEPEMVHQVLKKATEFITKYIKEFKKAGADGVIIAEPAAGLLSPSLNKEFSIPYVKKVVEELQDENFIVIYHNCGPNTVKMIDDLITVGASMYHFGNAIDLNDVKDKMPKDVIFAGNVSPADCFRNGTPESTYKATQVLLEKCGSYSNFVLSSGCDIPPLSSIENIQAFFDAAKKYYAF